MSSNGVQADDRASLISVKTVEPSADTLTKLVKRLRTLTLTLLPVEVPLESINDATSRVITPHVISAYMAAAGDLLEALPYALLRARKEFIWDANHNPADYGENLCRATACEVLARRVVHKSPPDRITAIMTSRFMHKEADGDESEKTSALEMAIDSHCTIFLSSSESQDVVNNLWKGQLVQKHNSHHDVDIVPYKGDEFGGIWAHLSPSRLAIPRYQNIFRILIWVFFLFTYSQAVREPLDKVANYEDLDAWEVVMYVLALAFSFEDIQKILKLLIFVSWRALGFWNIVSLITDSLLLSAFILRMAGIASGHNENSPLRLRSFQCLSFVAPLIWMKLIPIFDGYKYVGTMQICIARMLQESSAFFGLLALLGLGFLQGLYALDAADGQTDHPFDVVNLLVQALLQSPNYEWFNPSPAGLTLYYLWNVATGVILLNVLISLFSSAYDDVVQDAAAEYLAYFADKTVSMIRAPDEFIYPAPLNLIELFLVAPFEYIVSKQTYAKMNKIVMSTIFFVPLAFIALFEAELDPSKNKWIKDWLTHPDEGSEDSPECQNPEVDGEDAERGIRITKVPFHELIKVFPDTTQSSEAVIVREIGELKNQIEELKAMLLSLQRP